MPVAFTTAGKVKKLITALAAKLSHDHTDAANSGVLDHANLSNKGTTSHSALDTHVGNAALHRVINDAGDGVTELWSASQLVSAFGAKADVHSHPYAVDSHAHDLTYFLQSAFIEATTGVADALKPIKTNADGKVDGSFFPSGAQNGVECGFNNAPLAVQTGAFVVIPIARPFSIEVLRVTCNPAATIEMDFWFEPVFNNGTPVISDSICGGVLPTVNNNNILYQTDFSGWSIPNITVNGILVVVIASNSNATNIQIQLAGSPI